MDGYNGDVFFHGDDDGHGDGHSYGSIDATRDFLSQPLPTAGSYQGYSQASFTGPGSSHFASPRTSMAALDLNSQGSQWPPMGGYQGLLRFGLQGGDVDGPNASPPVGAHSASRSVGAGGVGFRAPRSTGVGAGSGCATSTFSGGGRGSGVPAVGRGASQRSLHGPRQKSTSGVAEGSTARGRRPRVPAVAEDNFASNASNDGDDVEILPNAPRVFFLVVPLHSCNVDICVVSAPS